MDLRDRSFIDDEGRGCLRGKWHQRNEGKKQDKRRQSANWHAPILADGQRRHVSPSSDLTLADPTVTDLSAASVGDGPINPT